MATTDRRPAAFLGLGGMGSAMALRLLDVGFPLTVWNRTPDRAATTVAAGAQGAVTAAEAVTGRDVVVVSLADDDAVEAVLFGGALHAMRRGTVVVDTSTVSPAFARAAAERLARTGVRRVEACVLGNPSQARAGQMRILTAGDPVHVDAVRPVLDALGAQVIHVGPAGAAATMKLVFNLLIGAQVASLAEAVTFGRAAGLDRDMLLTAIQESGFSSMVMAFRAAIMRDRRYEPAAFRARLMAKDLRLALAGAQGVGVAMPVTATAQRRFEDVVAAGDGDLDAAVLLELQEREAAAG